MELFKDVHSSCEAESNQPLRTGTSLGLIREVRAFGPQAFPLSDLNRFGIYGTAEEGWVRTFALPEVWFHLQTERQEALSRLALRFVGLKPETPLAFVFYVQAQTCQIGNQTLKPKSLQRFQGEASAALFEGKLKIESSQIHKTQVIPLAGEGCFWNADFLLAFELHPWESQVNFVIKN